MSGLHVVIGLGVSGLSCVRYLRQQNVLVMVMDTRQQPPHLAALKHAFPEVDYIVGRLDAASLQKATTIIVSPGVSLAEPLINEQVKQGKRVIGDIELFAQYADKPVIAITGTNAKSTVTTLVGEMMKAGGFTPGVGGNLGVPALDLLTTPEKVDVFVLELSSFQLETTDSLRPAVATILNISPDHMDRYSDYAAYQAAKHRIYHHAKTAVCNRDDDLTECKTVERKFYFTLALPKKNEFGLIEKNKTSYLAFENQLLMPVDDLPVQGKHYQANALASLAIGYSFGLSFESMLSVLREFKGLPHRCQFVREAKGVKWVNDSKGTNVGATVAAINGLGASIKGKLILLAGGVGKSADFAPLAPVIDKYVRHLILFGEAKNDIAAAMTNNANLSLVDSLEEAIALAAKMAKTHDCVLLSPACASFDMFKNYEHRGQVFMELVNQYLAQDVAMSR